MSLEEAPSFVIGRDPSADVVLNAPESPHGIAS